MKTAKVGNTTLKFNDTRAVKTQEEIDAILNNIAAITRKSLIDAEIKKHNESTA